MYGSVQQLTNVDLMLQQKLDRKLHVLYVNASCCADQLLSTTTVITLQAAKELLLYEAAQAVLHAYSSLQWIAVTRGSSAALLFKPAQHNSSSSSSSSSSSNSSSTSSNSSSNSSNSSSNSTATAATANDEAPAAVAVQSSAATSCSSYWRYSTPQVAAVNATGAGDCTTAITLRSWVQGASPEAAFRIGLAAASASCLR
jgi:pfkB family carbohydrate kinase